jgi:hypothetical protein
VSPEVQTEIVRCLLAAGAHVNQVMPTRSSSSASGETALFPATNAGNLPVIEVLLAAGANAKVAESDGRTPLHTAYSLCKGDKRPGGSIMTDGELVTDEDVFAIIKALEAAGAVDSTTFRGLTMLMSAARSGRAALVASVLAKYENKQAMLNAKYVEGRTAVTFATFEEGDDVVQMLLSAGADGRPALFSAAGYCDEAVVQRLLSAGVDGDARDEKGRTWQEVLQDAKNRNALDERVGQIGENLGRVVSAAGLANAAGCCAVQ